MARELACGGTCHVFNEAVRMVPESNSLAQETLYKVYIAFGEIYKSKRQKIIFWSVMNNNQTKSVTQPKILTSSERYHRCHNYMARKVWFCVTAWTWCHRHSHLNCLTTQGSTWDLGNCLLFMLLICVGIEWETWCCGSTIIENSKQKTTKQR